MRYTRTGTPSCKHCGKKLLRLMHTWYEHSSGTKEPIVGELDGYGYKITEIISVKKDPWAGKRIITYWTGAWGYHGNGLFCSLRCGFNHAVYMINTER
jgi:hypothetical protein